LPANGTRRGRQAPSGRRAVRKRRTSTFIAGLRRAGMTAPALFEGAINGEMFLAYIQQNLAPTLPQGDVVIMDNLASHNVAGVQEAINRKGARLLYLPA